MPTPVRLSIRTDHFVRHAAAECPDMFASEAVERAYILAQAFCTLLREEVGWRWEFLLDASPRPSPDGAYDPHGEGSMALTFERVEPEGVEG